MVNYAGLPNSGIGQGPGQQPGAQPGMPGTAQQQPMQPQQPIPQGQPMQGQQSQPGGDIWNIFAELIHAKYLEESNGSE